MFTWGGSSDLLSALLTSLWPKWYSAHITLLPLSRHVSTIPCWTPTAIGGVKDWREKWHNAFLLQNGHGHSASHRGLLTLGLETLNCSQLHLIPSWPVSLVPYVWGMEVGQTGMPSSSASHHLIRSHWGCMGVEGRDSASHWSSCGEC